MNVVDEKALDRIYPEFVRRSSCFWTPVEVGRLAASFLAPRPSLRVLDVGSGVGKFCIVGAAATGASFSGIEHRSYLVTIANQAARALRVSGTHFESGKVEEVTWSRYDAFYFFNPFEENFFQQRGFLDRRVALSGERFWRDVAAVEYALSRRPIGTRVATFHGFGGRMPRGYQLVAQHRVGGGVLRCWSKVSEEAASAGTFLEVPALRLR